VIRGVYRREEEYRIGGEEYEIWSDSGYKMLNYIEYGECVEVINSSINVSY
jgi:hypothetical protein